MMAGLGQLALAKFWERGNISLSITPILKYTARGVIKSKHQVTLSLACYNAITWIQGTEGSAGLVEQSILLEVSVYPS